MSSRLLSTVEVAAETGIPRSVLLYWVKTEKITGARTRLRKGVAVRLWSTADIEKAKKLRATLKRGPEPKKAKKKG